MKHWITLAESIWPEWQMWLFDHPDAASLLDDPEELLSRLPETPMNYRANAERVLPLLARWRTGERYAFRCVAIADWQDEFDGDELKAAVAYCHGTAASDGAELGNHWSRVFHDPRNEGGASIAYDSDAEGYPVLMVARVDESSVLWPETIVANIAYPHEEEITISGTVFLESLEVNGMDIPVNKVRKTGIYVH